MTVTGMTMRPQADPDYPELLVSASVSVSDSRKRISRAQARAHLRTPSRVPPRGSGLHDLTALLAVRRDSAHTAGHPDGEAWLLFPRGDLNALRPFGSLTPAGPLQQAR